MSITETVTNILRSVLYTCIVALLACTKDELSSSVMYVAVASLQGRH